MQSNKWLQHTFRRRGWRPQRQAIAVGTLGVFIALILGALYLSQVAMEASRGRDMRDLIALRDELERSNEELRVEIAELRSLSRLRTRAQELGFVPASQTDMMYVVVDGYNPNRGETVAPLEEETEDLPVYSETFGDWLRSQFEGFSNSGGDG